MGTRQIRRSFLDENIRPDLSWNSCVPKKRFTYELNVWWPADSCRLKGTQESCTPKTSIQCLTSSPIFPSKKFELQIGKNKNNNCKQKQEHLAEETLFLFQDFSTKNISPRSWRKFSPQDVLPATTRWATCWATRWTTRWWISWSSTTSWRIGDG